MTFRVSAQRMTGMRGGPAVAGRHLDVVPSTGSNPVWLAHRKLGDARKSPAGSDRDPDAPQGE